MRLFLLSILLIAGLSFPTNVANASTVEELQVQIQSLLDTIVSLQADILKSQNTQNTSEQISSSVTNSFIFTRNLSVGSKGIDVLNLQIILNSDSRTIVALSEEGSSGNETDYFGPLTKQAVIKFQELYSSEVLIPVDLSAGTGFVGPSTRKKLNSLSASSGLSTGVSTDPSTQIKPTAKIPEGGLITADELLKSIPQDSLGVYILPPISVNDEGDIIPNPTNLILNSLSTNIAAPGDILVLLGFGFSSTNNTVNFGSGYVFKGVPSSNGSQMSLRIPSNLPVGNYAVSVSNSQGTSDSVPFILKDINATPPVVTSIAPLSGGLGQEITIIGSGFTKTGNNIHNGFEIIENVSSPDGKILQFKIYPPSDLIGDVGTEHDVWIYVVNKNGVSNDPPIFKLTI